MAPTWAVPGLFIPITNTSRKRPTPALHLRLTRAEFLKKCSTAIFGKNFYQSRCQKYPNEFLSNWKHFLKQGANIDANKIDLPVLLGVFLRLTIRFLQHFVT